MTWLVITAALFAIAYVGQKFLGTPAEKNRAFEDALGVVAAMAFIGYIIILSWLR